MTSIGQPSHLRIHGALKTKKQIAIPGEEKESKSRQEKSLCPTPSMRNLEQEGHLHHTPGIESPQNGVVSPGAIKTNKQIPNQGHQGLTISLPFIKQIYRTINLLLSHIQTLITLKTGKVDFGGNFFNRWFLSEKYFNGI